MAEIKVNDDTFDVEEFFWVLDNIRESGKMNMFGAPKWLEENMDLTKEQAKQVSQKEAELSKKFEKEMASFKKGLGIKLPKKKAKSEEKLLWRM